jgi:hypothetical protein
MAEEIRERSVAPDMTAMQIFQRISWPAIFSGALVAFATEVLFAMFGFFVGFRLSSGTALVSWTTAWYLITSFCALFAGGWLAARLSGNPDKGSGRMHGLVTWGVTIFTTFVLILLLGWAAVNGILMGARTAGPAAPSAPSPQAVAVGQNQLSIASLIAFGGILLGALASLLGGAAGAPSEAGLHRAAGEAARLPRAA